MSIKRNLENLKIMKTMIKISRQSVSFIASGSCSILKIHHFQQVVWRCEPVENEGLQYSQKKSLEELGKSKIILFFLFI